MGKVIVCANLTLDGVMQSPGRPEEDPRGGFSLGGWAAPFGAMEHAGAALSNLGAFLFGRWTYESFHAFWPKQKGSAFAATFARTPKYVASTTLREPLGWEGSTLLAGDATKAVARLRREQEKDLVVFGSGVLVRSLMQRSLVDEYLLLIHPLILGSGRRLFPEEGGYAELDLLESNTTHNGVVIAKYAPIEETKLR